MAFPGPVKPFILWEVYQIKVKRIAAYLLSLSMIAAAVTGCGNNESNSSSASTASDTNSDSSTAASDNSSESASAADGEIEEIIMMYPIMGTITQTGAQGVEDAINAITEPEIGVHVSLNPIEIGSYAQQLNLMITSNEQLDVVATFPGGSATFSAMSSQNQLLPLDDLLDEYGTDIKDKLGDLVNATTIIC